VEILIDHTTMKAVKIVMQELQLRLFSFDSGIVLGCSAHCIVITESSSPHGFFSEGTCGFGKSSICSNL